MKTLIPLTALAALVASGFSSAQTPAFSKPSGYTTQVLKAGITSYVGMNVLPPTKAAGTITAVENSGLTLRDSNAAFSSTLTSGKMHTIEIIDGINGGSVREFNAFTNTSVPITAKVTSLAVGTKYAIRQNMTLQEMFPLGAPLKVGTTAPTGADIIRVPDGIGGYDRFWYKNSTTGGAIGWYKTTDGVAVGTRVTTDIPLLYTDGLLIDRKAGSDVTITRVGQVKTTMTRVYVITGLNAISINPPVGSSLNNSGLKDYFQQGATPATADILWYPSKTTGILYGYWYKNTTVGGPVGWYRTSNGTTTGTQVTTTIALPSCMLIQRRSTPKFMRISMSTRYASL